jgi:hypothetical protein
MNVIYDLKRNACLVSAFVLLVGQAVFCNAQTVLVDFGSDSPCYAGNPNPGGCGSYRGVSQVGADTNGNFWNSVQPGLFYPLQPPYVVTPAPGLVDLANNSTTLALGWFTPVGSDSYNGPAGAVTNDTYKTDVNNTLIDSVTLGNMGGSKAAAFDFADGPGAATPVTGNKVRFDIEHLDPTKKYDLTFFGSHSYSLDRTTIYKVYTDNTFSTLVNSTTLNVDDPAADGHPDVYNIDTVATISGLSPQDGNSLYIEFVGTTGKEGYLNELRIVGNTFLSNVTGDYNNNGKVDAADYTVWRDHLNQSYTLLNRDPLNGTGVVSPADYTSWKTHFGNSGSGGGAYAAGAVPEPSTMLLSLLASLAFASLSMRRPG